MAIYDTYYGCKLEPFSLNPDPRFLYMTPRHREALAQLRYVTMERRGFAVLTGEVGTGKTTMLRKVIEDVDSQVTTAYIFNPPRSLHELQESLSRELGLGWKEPQPFVACLNEFLLESLRRDRVVVVVFDEVQVLPVNILEEIRLLSNIETASAKLLQIVLAGQPEFAATLDSVELRALRQRVAMRCDLGPLRSEETAEYIGRRLRVAGARRSPFTFEACTLVHKYSGGIPRLINSICDSSMVIGYASDSPVIGNAMVEQAAQDLGLKSEPATLTRSPEKKRNRGAPSWRKVASYSALGIAVMVVAAVVLWLVVDGIGQQLYTHPRAALHQAYSFVTRNIDLPRIGAGAGSVGMPNGAAGGAATSDGAGGGSVATLDGAGARSDRTPQNGGASALGAPDGSGRAFSPAAGGTIAKAGDSSTSADPRGRTAERRSKE